MKESQCKKILQHLEQKGSITALVAFNRYGIMRLASRVNDLKKQGYDITTELVIGENRNGEPTRYAVYRLNN